MFDQSGRVLGVDPGLTRCGYAVLSRSSGGGGDIVALGVIRTPTTDDLARRLGTLQDEIEALIDEFRPTSVAVERVFFQSNVRTAMSVGQASGVILASAARHGLDVAMYTPTQVKSSVAGDGSASKAQIQKMVQMRLRLPRPPSPADAADAAAIALCHLVVSPFENRVRSSAVRS